MTRPIVVRAYAAPERSSGPRARGTVSLGGRAMRAMRRRAQVFCRGGRLNSFGPFKAARSLFAFARNVCQDRSNRVFKKCPVVSCVSLAHGVKRTTGAEVWRTQTRGIANP
jgi:hypothetical protein